MLNSSVKNNGAGVGVNVGTGVNVIVAVAGSRGVGDALVGDWNSVCVGTGVDVLQAVRNMIPTRVMRSKYCLFITEL